MGGRLTSTINIVLLLEVGIAITLCQLAFLPVVVPGTDARDEISMACIQNGYVILELYRERLTLEEVYLRLTQEADG